MPVIYLGLGSNSGDRRDNLRRALALLQAQELAILRLSPAVESAALLPKFSPNDWNQPFLNLVAEVQLDGSQEQWRQQFKTIEQSINNNPVVSSWAPRPIDIDILLWGDTVKTGLQERAFALSPLVYLQPDLIIPGLDDKTVFAHSRQLNHHIPLWMGIVNITPDSFSDGGKFTSWPVIEQHIDNMVAAGVHILDLGAESTRPNAIPLNGQQEWLRLAPILEQLIDKFRHDCLRPLLSVDTYHADVAEKALSIGVDIINDVSALSDPAMLELACANKNDWIVMHHVSIPARSTAILPIDADPYKEVETWLLQQLERWDKAGLDRNRMIIDPGIGFGKNGLQSLELLRQASKFRQHGQRLLIGHSRKSFLKNLSGQSIEERDLATIGASLELCRQGVDILRVHNIPAHIAAYRGWMHLQS